MILFNFLLKCHLAKDKKQLHKDELLKLIIMTYSGSKNYMTSQKLQECNYRAKHVIPDDIFSFETI
jgi:hypothetical protein